MGGMVEVDVLEGARVKVGKNVSATAGDGSVGDISSAVDAGAGVHVGDGASICVGCIVGSEVASRVTVGTGAGANSRSATGSPTAPTTTAETASANEVTSHCQPVTVRARRVR
jgi:hypothetical protein